MTVDALASGASRLFGLGERASASASRDAVGGAIPLAALAVAFVCSAALKLANVGVGGPQFMIDDFTLYEGGFLVWFGQAPPQHSYLESWICGAVSLAVFLVNSAVAGQWDAIATGSVVPNALRDFYNAPDAYYAAYRSVLVAVDLLTAAVVFRLARRMFDGPFWPMWIAVLFLFTYNTLWCALVGRPDTLLTFAAAVGVHLYLRSGGDTGRAAFWLAAVWLGAAAGLKMHGALFTVFVAVDLLRLHGIRAGIRAAVAFSGIAFFFFLVGDGSLLFDPLKYVKARWATYHDDYSPYIQWGDQFGVMFRATAWVIVPLAIAGAVMALRRRANAALASVAILALGWLVIFCATRQLRGYWMLPATPLLYILAAGALQAIRNVHARRLLAVAALLIAVVQTASVSWKTRHAGLDELRSWVTANVRSDERFYLVGEAILRLPKDTEAIQVYRAAYGREAAQDAADGKPFVERHLKNWEEAAAMRLFDMLDFQNERGFTFYSARDLPVSKFGDLVSLRSFDYLIVQQGFTGPELPGLERVLAEDFDFVAMRRSEGGDGSGLMHAIYRRVPQ